MTPPSTADGTTTLVLTVIGDDRSGLVVALADVIAANGGNWDESHMAELAGKFAGLVQVTVPDGSAGQLVEALEPLGDQGLLDVTVQVAGQDGAPGPVTRVALEVVGNDQPGIVREVASALALLGVNIEQLATRTSSAPMSGGQLFQANAVLVVPLEQSLDEVAGALEELSSRLVVDIELEPSPEV